MSVSRDWYLTLTGSASLLGDLAASAVEPILASEGLGIGSFDLLSAVRAAGGREPLAQVAARLGIVPSSLTEAVTAAERKGLLERLTSANDKRVRRLMLTDRGEQLLNNCLQALAERESKIRAAISTSEVDAAIRTIQRACEVLQTDGG